MSRKLANVREMGIRHFVDRAREDGWFATHGGAPVSDHECGGAGTRHRVGGRAADIPLGSPAFAAQWNAIEPKAPNFWGPADQNIFPEQYQEASGGPSPG